MSTESPIPRGLGGDKIQRHLAPTLHVAHHRSNSPSLIVSSILDSLLAILETAPLAPSSTRIGCVKTDHPRSTAFSSSIGNLRGSVIGPRLGHPSTLVGFCKIKILCLLENVSRASEKLDLGSWINNSTLESLVPPEGGFTSPIGGVRRR